MLQHNNGPNNKTRLTTQLDIVKKNGFLSILCKSLFLLGVDTTHFMVKSIFIITLVLSFLFKHLHHFQKDEEKYYKHKRKKKSRFFSLILRELCLAPKNQPFPFPFF